MRKWFLGTVLAAVIAVSSIGCGKATPFVTLYAQSLPITKTLAWDAAANADSYLVRLDGTTIGSPTGLTQPFTITALGPHTLMVSAVNIWGTSVSTLNFVVATPGVVGNPRIQ